MRLLKLEVSVLCYNKKSITLHIYINYDHLKKIGKLQSSYRKIFCTRLCREKCSRKRPQKRSKKRLTYAEKGSMGCPMPSPATMRGGSVVRLLAAVH